MSERGSQELTPARPTRSVRAVQLFLGVVGLALIVLGAKDVLVDPDKSHPVTIVKWLVGAVILHDGIIAPVTIVVAWVLARLVPGPRARAYLQGGLITAALVTALAIPLIHRRGLPAGALSLLQRDYLKNLLILLGAIAVVTGLLYAIRVWRDANRNSSNSRPSADHDAVSE